MGLEQVKSKILEEAEERADDIVEEAEEEKQEIIEEAEQEAEEIKEEAREEVEEEKESIRKEKLSNARMKAKDRKLETRQEYVDRVFSSFREGLEELTDSERKSFVDSCLDKVRFEVGKVKGGEEFEDAVEDQGLDFEEKDMDGIVIVSEDGERRQDFSFDRVVEQYREQHRKEVADQLFH